ncbi:MAG: alkylhydroperoxidase [Lysobacterales bacterium]|nr:MAG: alkylhydroperoxidase [Xanthomonadales bacterium]
MPYIKVIQPAAATGRLAKIYERVTGPGGQVDNVLQIHSLRPHTLEGHMALYKAVLHHPRNSLPRWFLEAIAVRVSLLNDCEYCARHHAAGMERLLQREPGHYDAYRAQLDAADPGKPFSRREQAALLYVDALTRQPGSVGAEDVAALRGAGWKDGQILEINQVAAYFAYANRTVTGLGVNSEGEDLGLSADVTDL